MNGKQLQTMLDRAGVTQVGAARELKISGRQMRRYIANEVPIPNVVEVALRTLILNSGKRAVSIEGLSAKELRWWSNAVDAARASVGERFIHCEPVRDKSNRFSELHIYDSQNGRLLCTVTIAKNGIPAQVEVNPKP